MRELILKMLTKDPLKRVTVAEIKLDAWLNEGCKRQLSHEETPRLLAEITQEDLNHAVTPIHTLVWAKKIGKKWR